MTINTREIAAMVLDAVWKEEAYANIALNKAFQENALENRDRGFVTNLVYGSLKRWNAVEYQLQKVLNKPIKKKDAFLGILLHIALFEILFTSTPPRAAVNECVVLAKKHGHQGWGNLANGVLRNVVRGLENISWPSFADEIEKALFFQSLPSWLGTFWCEERGEKETLALLDSLEEVRPLSFRVNSLKTDRESFLNLLSTYEIQGKEGLYSPYCIKSSDGNRILRIPEYKMGFCTVQEEGSQLAVLALAPKAGETVLDVCAAPGGKTAFMAQLMKNQGKIFAGDIHPHKIKLIEDNAKRLGITIITPMVKDGTLWGDTHCGYFDCILLDAPCSGLGVLSRRQDARFHKASADIGALQIIQRSLLDSAVKALRPGGRMVFSTCTLTQKENQENRQYLLETYEEMQSVDLTDTFGDSLPNTTLKQGWLELLPHIHQTDGFYIAAFEKRK